MNLLWLLRMRRWAQHPPSKQRLILIAVVVGASFGIYFFEYFFGWPEWLTVNTRIRR